MRNISVDVGLLIKKVIKKTKQPKQTEKDRKHCVSFAKKKKKPRWRRAAGKNLPSRWVRTQLGAQIVHVWRAVSHPVPTVLMGKHPRQLGQFVSQTNCAKTQAPRVERRRLLRAAERASAVNQTSFWMLRSQRSYTNLQLLSQCRRRTKLIWSQSERDAASARLRPPHIQLKCNNI